MVRPLLPLVATLLVLTTAMSGCTDGFLAGDSDGTWYAMKGVQCEATPWDAWADRTGYKPSGAAASEPFQYDERTARLMKAYFAAEGPSVQSTWAYFDERAYPSVCGAANANNYFVLAKEAPTAGTWLAMDKTPEQAAADREP